MNASVVAMLSLARRCFLVWRLLWEAFFREMMKRAINRGIGSELETTTVKLVLYSLNSSRA